MVDGVLLLTDAVGGPQAQTRWVLKKALNQGLKTICVINKIDRDTARSEWVHDKVLELFLDLEADDDQFNAPFLYASAKNGFADREVNGARTDMTALLKPLLNGFHHQVLKTLHSECWYPILIGMSMWDEWQLGVYSQVKSNKGNPSLPFEKRLKRPSQNHQDENFFWSENR